jgi:protein-tyrosine-phosphatase
MMPYAAAAPPMGRVLFVCTHNSARSQFAEGLWRLRTGGAASSAGSEPSRRVHPHAVRAAARRGVDLSAAAPRGYKGLDVDPTLVVSVCDRAHEGEMPFEAPVLHWSVPDPVAAGNAAAFTRAFDEIADRIESLAGTMTSERSQ